MSHALSGPWEAASRCEAALKDAKFQLVARVRASQRAVDLGARTPSGATLVFRCVQEPQPTDYLALRTMVLDGDFDDAVLVHWGPGVPAQQDLPGVETCSVDELPRFLALKGGAR